MAFTRIDMYTKGAEGVLLPTLPVTMAQPCYKPLCPDALGNPLKSCKPMGGPECKVAVAQQARAYCDRHRIARPYKKNEQAYIKSFNRR